MLAEPPVSMTTTLRNRAVAALDALDEPDRPDISWRTYLLTFGATSSAVLLLASFAEAAAL